MDRLSRRSCEGNDHAAGILVRDDYVISRNGKVTREEICPYAICVCIYACPRNSIHFHFHVVYTEPRASVRRIIHGTLVWYQHMPRIRVRYICTYVPMRAMNACRHAVPRGFAIILSIMPGIEVNLRQRLAERWECTLIEITTIRLTGTVVLGMKNAYVLNLKNMDVNLIV